MRFQQGELGEDWAGDDAGLSEVSAPQSFQGETREFVTSQHMCAHLCTTVYLDRILGFRFSGGNMICQQSFDLECLVLSIFATSVYPIRHSLPWRPGCQGQMAIKRMAKSKVTAKTSVHFSTPKIPSYSASQPSLEELQFMVFLRAWCTEITEDQ